MKQLATSILKATRLYAPVERLTRPARLWRRRRAWRALYGTFVGKGDLCFDIGANVGERTEIFLSLGARVVAVEPQASLLSRFAASPNVIVVSEAVSDHVGTARIALSRTSTELATLEQSWVERGPYSERGWGDSQDVKTTTLDDLIARHGVPSFCKIDVEGHERAVLTGLSRPLPALSFEFTRQFLDHADACMRRIESLGPATFNANLWPGPIRLESSRWLQRRELLSLVESAPADRWCGDIYARSL